MSDSVPRPHFLLGTGHRPETMPTQSRPLDEILRDVRRQLRDVRARHLSLCVLVGGARGFDLWLARLAQEEEIPYELCLVGSPGQHRWAWRDAADVAELHSLMETADAVTCFWPLGGGTWHPAYARDRHLLRRAHSVLALYDGRPTGGTSAVVREAWTVCLPVTVVHPGHVAEMELDVSASAS